MAFKSTNGYLTSILDRTFTTVRADSSLYLAIITYAVAGVVFLDAIGAQDRIVQNLYFGRWSASAVLLIPAFIVMVQWARVFHRFNRRRRGLAFRRLFSVGRMARLISGTLLLFGFMLFQGTFTSIKNGLPVWRGGFLYDHTQATIDAFLCFGVDPWRVLYALAGKEWVLRAVEWNYGFLWFFICFGAVVFVALSPRADSVRGVYLFSFMLVWIVIGNILAGLFISAGPAYYGVITGDVGRFADQLAFLRTTIGLPNSAASYQAYLWSLEKAGTTGFGSGISAFPSIHVGVAALNAIFLWDIDRRLGLVGFLYTAFMLASSVLLAWHYAIDGFVAIATVFLIVKSVKTLAIIVQPPTYAISSALQSLVRPEQR